MAEENEKALAEFMSQPKPAAPPANEQTGLQEFLTAEEAAALLRVNVETLRNVIKDIAPPWAKPIGHQVRISRAALLKWFETEVTVTNKRRRAV